MTPRGSKSPYQKSVFSINYTVGELAWKEYKIVQNKKFYSSFLAL